nr:hypothetical protein [Burkholderia multivorans]
MGAEGIWRTIKNFLTLSERGNVKPISDITDPPPRPTRASFHRITDRQVEIMTATLCDVIATKKLPPDEGKEMVGQLIRAMVTQVSRLNEAVAKASRSPDVEVKMKINNIGQPVVETDEDRIAAFARWAR